MTSSFPAPSVTMDGTAIVVATEIKDAIVLFRFDSVIYAKNDIEAMLLCSVMPIGGERQDFESRINCLSNSSRESFARQLTVAFGKEAKWVLVLSRVCTAFVHAYRESVTQSVKSKNNIIPKQLNYLLPPFLEEGEPNILFGRGGSGKTFLALKMAMSLAGGDHFLGNLPSKSVQTLFLDYESSEQTFSRRIDQLKAYCPEWRENADELLYYLPSKGIPVYELQETLQRIIQTKKIDFLIVDSAALACGGAPEDAQNAIRYFNALNTLGITTLTIAHQSKTDESGAYVFGSVFWNNCARNIWNIRTDSEQDENVIHAGLIHRKSNNDRLRTPLGARIYFDDKGVDINYENPIHCGNEQGLKKRILLLLKEGPKSSGEIADELDADKQTVKSRLQDLKKKEIVANPSRNIWEIKAEDTKKEVNLAEKDESNTPKVTGVQKTDEIEW